MMKSFRGVIPHGEQDTIRLQTNTGETGYMIRKFQIISTTPGADTCELVCKIWANKQVEANVDGEVDFDNAELLGVCYFQNVPVHSSSAGQSPANTIIFDHVKINQNIFVTSYDESGNTVATSYYIELEKVKLSLDEATVATLKDIRGS